MLFAGTFWAGSSEAGLAQGFRENGWCVQEVETSHFDVQPSHHVLFRIASRISRNITAKQYRQKILSECKAVQPDILFTVKGIYLDADLINEIKSLGTRVVMFYPDVDFDHKNVFLDSFNKYDLFITTKSFQSNYLSQIISSKCLSYIPHGFSPTVHRPVFQSISESDFLTDVIHAGNHSSFKQSWLEKAAIDLPDVSFRIIGNNWRKNAGSGALRKIDMPGPRTGIAYAAAIQTARINVAVHMGPTKSGWADLVSTRTFEIPACRGFMLHIDNDEIREFYKPGVEIDVFRSHEELADKVRFYLARPDTRKKMIDRAYERCVPNYSYSTRAKSVSQILIERNLL
jgi:spore maturation protein CgeB